MKKRFWIIPLSFLLFLVLNTCRMDSQLDRPTIKKAQQDLEGSVAPGDLHANPDPSKLGPLPEATVPLLPDASTRTLLKATTLLAEPPVSSLTPDLITATLKPGDILSEHKTAFLPANIKPRKGDILFSFDLTGSMWDELANVKVNAQNIMNTIKLAIPDMTFGVVSHMDYPAWFESCGYSGTYGNGAAPYYDYPYQLNRSLTGDTLLVKTAIEGLPQGDGSDGPEDYTRVFSESYSDSGIGWRDGAKRIVLAWLDAVPHDCNFAEIYDPALDLTTGKDPGRDGMLGDGYDADNLEIIPVLNGMKALNTTLIVIYSNDDTEFNWWGTGFPLWQAYTAVTGGSAFQINDDGTIPGGMDIAEFVAGLITEEIMHIDKLSLQVLEPAYASWLVSVIPPEVNDIDLDKDTSIPFDIQIKVPDDAVEGEHSFNILLVGDGVEYARQQVHITVVRKIEVSVDIKPGSCPNPFNVGSNGVLPVAIAGTGTFDVSKIDPASVRLEGVPALRWSVEDVTIPYEPFVGKPLDEMACNTYGPDGIPDLTLKFDSQTVAAAMGSVSDREVRILHLTGTLFDGPEILGEDVVRFLLKH